MPHPLAPASRATQLTHVAIVIVTAAVAWWIPPLAQDAGYHAFADRRAVGGWPNVANVWSNAIFLVAGIAGLRSALRDEPVLARPAWIVTFAGIALVAVGSAWYHLAPSDATLVWDRLPMTVGFMGLAAAILARTFGEPASRWLLPLATAIGIASVIVWQATGDLRLYVWVQFTPLLLIAATLALAPMSGAHRATLLSALVLYVAAKGFELGDEAVWTATHGAVSGHTLKHLAAGMACAALIRLIR